MYKPKESKIRPNSVTLICGPDSKASTALSVIFRGAAERWHSRSEPAESVARMNGFIVVAELVSAGCASGKREDGHVTGLTRVLANFTSLT
jgi:hypothetical protein